MTSTPVPPRPFDHGSSKGIQLDTWRITSTKLPILNATESDNAQAQLHLPLPEICFGNNRLTLHDSATNLSFQWNALDALKAVAKDTEVKVAYADEWARGQANSGSADVAVQKPFDWTYTTVHPGSVSSSSPSPSSSDTPQPQPQAPTFLPALPSHPGIPLHLLARQDIPILFYDEIPLFEDELGDNGIAELVVRVRVNSTSIFVLSRFFLRIDHVLFRIFDVRLYHALGSGEVIRELKGRQAGYDEVKARLPFDKPSDLTPLTDINWVHAQLESLANGSSSSSPSPPSSRPSPSAATPLRHPSAAPASRFPGSGSSTPTTGLGRTVEGMGRLEIGSAGGAGGEGGKREKESKLPKWEAEGVRLERLELPAARSS